MIIYDPETLTEKQVRKIWAERINEFYKETPISDPCFNYTRLITGETPSSKLYFTKENWKDPYIEDFRNLIEEFKTGEISNPNYEKLSSKLVDSTFKFGYTSTALKNPNKVYIGINMEDEYYILLYNNNSNKSYIYQQKNSRGNIQDFFSVGGDDDNITLYEFTQLLICMGFVNKA